MKNIKSISIMLAIIFTTSLLNSCKKDFIQTEPRGSFSLDAYYQDQSQAFAALVAAYDILKKNSGGFDNMVCFFDAASDDQLAGGGGESDGVGIHSITNFTINADRIPSSFWGDHYQGIYRANILLQKVPNTNMDAALKNRYLAEAKALRAIYYFNLVRMFKNVPLILEPIDLESIYKVQQSTPEAVYTQIEKDLTEAIPVLPLSFDATVVKTEGGRLTQAAAKAMLGKVYLYEKKNSLAVTQLADVNGTPGQVTMYGNKLLANFSDLWAFSNKFNTESILEVTHSSQGNTDWSFWGGGADEGNTVNQMVGPRSYTRVDLTAPNIYGGGWSFVVYTQNFVDAIKTDPRFASTVFDINPWASSGKVSYVAGYQNTGYFVRKFLPTPADVRTGGGVAELNFQQDSYIIRLADTYLMEAEALGATGARAQALLDAVRARVGLPSVPVTLAAIKNERRLELAAEGHRFFDLVRWGDAPAVLGGRGFVTGKNEILPIPASELKGTQLKQNPNY